MLPSSVRDPGLESYAATGSRSFARGPGSRIPGIPLRFTSDYRLRQYKSFGCRHWVRRLGYVDDGLICHIFNSRPAGGIQAVEHDVRSTLVGRPPACTCPSGHAPVSGVIAVRVRIFAQRRLVLLAFPELRPTVSRPENAKAS